MNAAMFAKMRVKIGCSAAVLYAPAGYPKPDEYRWTDTGDVDFVHLFLEGREQFQQRFAQASAVFKQDGLFWVSYPKAHGKVTYDINRDSLWGLLVVSGFHPVSQVALDDEWSAVRVKRNEPGVVYESPANVRL